MKYLSTFTGIGGFEVGIQRAIPLAQCIGYSEVNKRAIKTYEEHFKHKNYGDITTINATDLPDFDLIVGGFPCQAFSIAGKRHGFNETRGTLFFDLARILKDKQPRHFVFENVKGLLSHDSGQTFQTILKILAELGYRVEWQVLNSKNFGVPQNRERVYIIGHLRERCAKRVLPIRQNAGQALIQIGNVDTAGHNSLWGRVYSTNGAGPTINALGGGVGAKTGLILVGNRVRKLSAIECERQQGFPDNWTLGHTVNARRKLCGNAVTTNVVEAVMLAVKHCFNVNNN